MTSSNRESTTSTGSDDSLADLATAQPATTASDKPHDGWVVVTRGPNIGRVGLVINRKSSLLSTEPTGWRYSVRLSAHMENDQIVKDAETLEDVFKHDDLRRLPAPPFSD
ncbi:hypothetical protein GLOTRDRAFT_130187 [Gloeophyllum trabeum ATCC 11539]|uniref:Uncharacterized protein n=1 Tax=Gloeophyllum trabeum (strain ATCC 11539 / FP-39264 / Madison 617) TaxID=670483 RepID=S7Q5U1_GLOTA|nr:uncharacterized protein GLOTRDRAFT_130187 [Gloeophyllum trabeum ATCC 11539]EPQ54838.1 hypothetical protein GLOTRDRAFT_130187 [Gloeophyllum trabeum ATCC 11539]